MSSRRVNAFNDLKQEERNMPPSKCASDEFMNIMILPLMKTKSRGGVKGAVANTSPCFRHDKDSGPIIPRDENISTPP